VEDKLNALFQPFCEYVAAGRYREAHALIRALPPGTDFPDLKLQAALAAMLASVEDREKQLATLVAELAVLRASQEKGVRLLEEENSSLRKNMRKTLGRVVGLTRNAAMQTLIGQIERIADVPVNMLITGETGTGKGLIARYIHYAGARAKRPFVGLNCAAIPASLLESELFGIEKGVASGVSARIGHFEQASGGTLFLDEIGDMPMESQAKILSALENGYISRVGGRKPVEIDPRIIAATHRDLEEACEQGTFRQDLFFRLNVIRLHIPSLRERREDIPLLAQHFLHSAGVRYRLQPMRFAPETLDMLEAYSWPGNVRELEHIVERCALLAATSRIEPQDLPPQLLEPAPENSGRKRKASASRLQRSDPAGNLAERLQAHPGLLSAVSRRIAAYTARSALFEVSGADATDPQSAAGAAVSAGTDSAKAKASLSGRSPAPSGSLRTMEAAYVMKALEHCGRNKSRTAAFLGITREGLRKKMKRLGLT
jgi:DNA-binding NtrC family response regulator